MKIKSRMFKLNIKIFLIIFFSVFFLGMTFILFSPLVLAAESSGGGIVPCGTDSTGPCTLCHFIIGIQKLVQYGLYLVTTMAFVGIFIGGAMYMISTGDSAMIESAKRFIGASLVGFALVLGAWLIVNIILNVMPVRQNLGIGKTNWYTFKCDTTSTQGSGTKDINSSGLGGSNLDTANNKKVSCGDGNKGTCWTNTGGYCPDEYTPLSGGTSCTSRSGEGITKCCIKNSDLTSKNTSGKDVITCGAGLKGTCFANTAGICPDGYEGLSGGTSCTGGAGDGITKCCIKSSESVSTSQAAGGCCIGPKGSLQYIFCSDGESSNQNNCSFLTNDGTVQGEYFANKKCANITINGNARKACQIK